MVRWLFLRFNVEVVLVNVHQDRITKGAVQPGALLAHTNRAQVWNS